MGGNPTWGYVSECGGHKSLATNKEKINSNKMCNKSEAFLAGPVCVAWKDQTAWPLCTAIMVTPRDIGEQWNAAAQVEEHTALRTPAFLLCIQTFCFYRNVAENKFGFHKSFHEFDLGLGQNYQQFLKLPSARFCLFTGVLTQSRILSPDDHKTKTSINLKILKILCTYNPFCKFSSLCKGTRAIPSH